MNLFTDYAAVLKAALAELTDAGTLPTGLSHANVTVEPPRDASHGDLATNAAMVLAKPAGMNPRALAEALVAALRTKPGIAAAEVAGPGFINLKLADSVWHAQINAMLGAGSDYGRSTVGQAKRINVEYVSANPTGPMHMGHCRGAVVGDALAGLLEYAGWDVTKEYYINDAGGQVDTLARSAHLRYREALGETIEIPEGFYPGDYLVPVGAALAAEFGDTHVNAPEADWLALFRTRTVALMMERIRADLALLGIEQSVFFSEASLGTKVQDALDTLTSKGLIYEGVLEKPKGDAADDWEARPQTLFRSTDFGDDQDRAMQKSNGNWTYFAGDVAYHWDKLTRGYDALVNIFGADHAGYVKRMTAAVKALSDGRVPLDIKIVNLVKLLRAGEPVKMSKRAGTFVTLGEVVEEVGKDVVRFVMLTKRPESMMDFDFAKVVEQSRDNPVFYVQYAHARIASLGRKVLEAGVALPEPDLTLLDADELNVVKMAANFPRIVEQAADAREPHRIAFYLGDLAAAFHSQWNAGNDDATRRFVLADRPDLTAARLAMARAVGQVIRNGLAVIGVAAAEELH
ncbi:arginine--tRNA ligase [Sandarakinorhabdus limnophila]|uniref:arginine--tRNA ligase n=1 Tax=Sandarakinorhabdus limnophila TaxID=210512 RepID=UPI0026EF249A|nr:arginine--tRNA ligase [Sandarakinorhabdus limnophila]MCM0031401.1 arginine--tRNA ligase [Sandarakinorhabdus limnophila]